MSKKPIPGHPMRISISKHYKNYTKQNTNTRSIFWGKFFFTFLFFVGAVLLIWEISLYRMTLISFYIPFSIFLTVGLVFSVILKKFYFSTYKNDKNYASNLGCFNVMNQLFGFGSIGCFLFLAINFYFAENEVKSYSLSIIGKGSMAGNNNRSYKRQPLAYVIYKGEKKELVFSHALTREVEISDKVMLKVRKGRLGFEILDGYYPYK